MLKKASLVTALLALALLGGCSTLNKSDQVSLPMFKAWYDGSVVYYITTDISDPDMALAMRANYVPRLQDAIPVYPKPPEQKTVLERVYTFPGGEQSKSVFASIPQPLGPGSQDNNYSPVWLMVTVTWKDPQQAIELRSEGEIFAAEARGEVDLTRTDIVVNCPVVGIANEGFLPL